MMQESQQKKRAKSDTGEPIKDHCTRWLKRLSAWMGRKSSRLPLRTKKAMLLCIVCTVGIYCSLKIVSVFEQNESPEKDAGSRVSISIPEHTRQQSDSRINLRTDRDKVIL